MKFAIFGCQLQRSATFFLKFFCTNMFMGSLPGVLQPLIILSLSIYELSGGIVKQWFYPILPKRRVPMWREWIEFFKYLLFKSRNSAVFKWLHIENCSGSPCTHPQDSVGAQTWDRSGMRKREERRISMKRKGLRKERNQFRNIHKIGCGSVAQWAESRPAVIE